MGRELLDGAGMRGKSVGCESVAGSLDALTANGEGGYAKGGLVGVGGFEPPASASRTQRSTRLSHTPKAD